MQILVMSHCRNALSHLSCCGRGIFDSIEHHDSSPASLYTPLSPSDSKEVIPISIGSTSSFWCSSLGADDAFGRRVSLIQPRGGSNLTVPVGENGDQERTAVGFQSPIRKQAQEELG